MKTSAPQELMGPNARLWVSRPMRTSSCSSEHVSLSCPRKSTALLQPPGSDRASGDKGGVSTSNSEFYSLLPSWSCSPEFNGIEEIHLCSFASTHSVAERHQGAGVQLTRTLLGWVQHGGEQRSQLAWKQWWPRHRRHRTGSVSQTYFSSLEMQVEFFKTRDVQYWLFRLNLTENL